MDGLIKIVNQLQDAFSVLGQSPLDLPQIAVVGGQSAGKSSVLENIVGRDFLPRGSGIVTRRPLVLKLVTVPSLKQEYAEFLHLPGTKITEWAAVRTAIETATEDEPECSNKGISNKPINLTIYSANVLNLTLIDLPGMTRVAVGDQPKDINEQIKAMIMHYITQVNTIVLAVSPANQDLANSDAVQLALSVDPNGDRTVGVLTKLDLMDKGTDAMEVLNNKVIPLKLGYIPVVNRSQHDINTNKALQSQWDEEKKYFASHSTYKTITERCGTGFLVKTLNSTLVKAIKSCLPDITKNIHKLMQAKRDELGNMEELEDPSKRSNTVLNSVVDYANKFREMIEGSDDGAPIEGIVGGAKIAAMFRGELATQVNGVDVLGQMSPAQLRNIIRNSAGLGGGLFIPDQAFALVIRRAVKHLETPALECVANVYDELLSQAISIETSIMGRYENLSENIHQHARELISAHKDSTMDLVKTLIEMEMSLINTRHPHFRVERAVSIPMAPPVPSLPPSELQIVEEEMDSFALPEPPRVPGSPGTSSSNAIIEGRLEQKKDHGRMRGGSQWVPRFLSIKNQSLYWGDDKNVPAHDMPLNGSTSSFVPGDNQTFSVSPAAGGKTATFRCADAATAQQWMQCLQMAQSSQTWALAQKKFQKPVAPVRHSLRQAQLLPRAPTPATGGIPGRMPSKSMTSKDVSETQIIENLLVSYFDIVKTKILDSIPKAIALRLVNKVKTSLQTDLVSRVYQPEKVDALLSESEESAEKRERLAKTLVLMEKAMQAIKRVQREATA